MAGYGNKTVTLREKQSRFVRMIADLIAYAYENGYEMTFAEAYRPPELAELYEKQGRGIKNSLHTQRLAIDLNLFKDGNYLTDGSGHNELHDFWDAIGGAKRIAKDLNHYSILHNGTR